MAHDLLVALARRIQAQPWNRPGTDKTWVLNALWQHAKFRDDVQRAERVATR